MKALYNSAVWFGLFAVAFALTALPVYSEDKTKDEAKPQVITLAEGKLQLTAPAKWVVKKPSSRIIEHEFAAPASEGDKEDARLTIMGAGGSVDANIERWNAQFTGKVESKREKKKIGELEVHLVDLAGTYKDQRGPAAGTVTREDYRMLAAIIVSEKEGQYFVKLYGPKKTIADQQKAFREMIESVKAK